MQPTIVLFGGDGRLARRVKAPVDVIGVPSSADGSTRDLQALCQRVRNGRVQAVVVLTKWVGHPAKNYLKRLCVRLGVHYCEVWGSLSRVRTTLRHLQRELHHAC